MNWLLIVMSFICIILFIFIFLIIPLIKSHKKKVDGILTVDLSGESIPVQLKLNIGINDIMQRKFVTLKTEVINLNIPIEIDKEED